MADFAALYPAELGIVTQESTDKTLTRAPPPLAARTGAKALLTTSGPR